MRKSVKIAWLACIEMVYQGSLPKLLATVANLIAIGDGSGGGEEPGLQDQVHGLSQLLVRSPTHSPGLGR